jgi:serine/threonine protein kinase
MILDLCDGDLEQHIEKEKSLSESEAIYFMKQIANGFQELNKWRIMHRDFKPANVMLQGDVIKIGDFGFAKMGATITNTGLGTPVTMAPELLNAKPGASYTDKIDLWSIGVVFYMMLYGNKGPFTFKKYTELQNAVETQSGKNLKFGVQLVSDEAKDLLRRLIEPNVDARIGWNDFFNDNLFKVQDKKEAAEDFVDLGRSVMCHGNKANVNLLFGRNGEKRTGENRTGAIDKIAIDKIELGEIEQHYNTKATKTQNA